MVDLDDVARRLGGALRGHAPLTGGVSSRVTCVELALPDGATRRVVVREPGTAAWKGPVAQTAEREHALLGYLHGAGLPVPRPLLLDEGRGAATPFFVMELVEGTSELPDDAPARLADLLARVHGVPLAGAPALPDREDPVAAIAGFLGPERDALRAWFAAGAVALAPRRALLHGDYWPGNVVWRDGAIAALLDWEDAAVGDPLSDVACCRLELRYVLGATGAEAFTRRYAQHAACPPDELAVWSAYVAAAALASMGQWGLPAEREARMRREAEAALAEAEAQLLR